MEAKLVFKYLALEDLDEMVKVEKETWIEPLQASRETMERRLKNGHKYLGCFIDGKLVGMVGWSRQKISSIENFPDDFHSFSNGSIDPYGNAAFIYNVGVSKNLRRKHIGSRMFQEALKMAKEEGVNDVYLDGRCPSYNGSEEEGVTQSLEFRNAIDECEKKKIATGTNIVPSDEDIQYDPTLKFYYKNGLRPVLLTSPGFLAADHTSGGYRVVMYTKL